MRVDLFQQLEMVNAEKEREQKGRDRNGCLISIVMVHKKLTLSLPDWKSSWSATLEMALGARVPVTLS